MLKRIIGFTSLFLLMFFVAFQLPQTHDAIVRNHVNYSLVKIMNEEGTIGGTGFHIKTPHGKVYILTNKHVCEGTKTKEGTVTVWSNDLRSIPRKIVEESKSSDLCLVEPVEGIPGLILASGYDVGVEYQEIGHPRLFPTTVSKGEFIVEEIIWMIDHAITSAEDACSDKYHQKVKFFGNELCLVGINAIITNIPTLGGNSGSPVVNWWGKVVGIIFAADNQSNWGVAIPSHDIKDFTVPY